MPRRTDGPPPRAPQSEPYETTGAFALPTDSASGFPPANDPAGAFPPPPAPRGPEAGPFETTGAFARPPEWEQPSDRPFGEPGPFNGPGPHNSFFDGPADQTGFFAGPADRPGAFDGPGDRGLFDEPGRRGPYDGPADQTARFDGPADQTARFDGPADGTARFDAPFGRQEPFGDPFGRPDSFDGPADRTARFDAPSGPNPVHGVPPEPGDIKVAGEPTAVQAPAWADAETGFLGSGWSNDGADEPDEPRGRRGRRRSGRGGGGGGGDDVLAAPSGAGKGRVALLSVAAVAVVLGGTVAGVKFMSSGEPAKCEGTSCAAVQATTSQPGPSVSDPAEEEAEAAPEEEPSEEGEGDPAAETPTPTPTFSARQPSRTASATPTPTKTRVKKQAEPTEDPTDEPPADQTASEAPSEEASTLDEDDTGGASGTEPTPVPTATGTIESASGASVNVKQTIRQRLTTYKADLTLSNTSAETLPAPTVSVPVDGTVVDVDGAEWTQDGDLLILDLTASVAAGDSVQVTFTATGRGSKAQNCGLVSGECAVI
ncbi:hypothetical protein ACBJ59_18100 [Nonomuraea sp. MTCD27]|uniref:hypothetical protein n=1 Tax=Nonomuraea sp. MTCD27 TaxID=1676747 RepID=UPI0035BEF708